MALQEVGSLQPRHYFPARWDPPTTQTGGEKRLLPAACSALPGPASPGSPQPAPVTRLGCSVRTGGSYQLENQRRKKLPSADEASLRPAARSSSSRGHVSAKRASSPGRAGRAPPVRPPPAPAASPEPRLTVIHVEHLLPVVLLLPVLLGGGDEGLLPPPARHRGLPAAPAVLHGAALLHRLPRARSAQRLPEMVSAGLPRPCRRLQGHSPRQGESLW